MEKEILTKLTEKNLSEGSIKMYFQILKNLNDKKEIKNLKFIESPKRVLDRIKDYKITTQRNIIVAIVSVLKAFDNEAYNKYYKIMMKLNKEIEDKLKTGEKSETQKKNWMKWDEVEEKFDEMDKNTKFPKDPSEEQYDSILNLVILGLYVLMKPRRNKDYLMMKVSKDMDDKNYNYLDLKKKQFVFNNYKTSRTYGTQIIDIPKYLLMIIMKYLKSKKGNSDMFLVKFDGEPLTSDNAITRRLNKIFGKNISSSMLRHIYLTDRYSEVLDEQKKDAELMGHSVQQQKEYIKN